MRLLLDANLSPRVATILGEAGHDAIHVFDVGLADATDLVILEHAAADRRVVVSSDTDFGALLARQQRSDPSYILLRHANDLSVDEQAALLGTVLPAVEDALTQGAVVTLSRGRVQLRRLPFGVVNE